MSLVAVIDHLAEQARCSASPEMEPNAFFELFVSDLITREFTFGWEELESGIVDGQGDGQIDAIYILVDDQLIQEVKDINLKKYRRNANLRILLQQSKNKVSFEENPFSKMRSSIQDLFDLSKSLTQFAKSYNTAVIAQCDLFRQIYLGLQGKNPNVSFQVFNASKGDATTVNARMESDAAAIRDFLQKEYFQSSAAVEFLGARELVDLANRARFVNKSLQFIVTPASDNSNSGWVGLVALADFFRFITDDKSQLIPSMFEENVRDFEGDAGVNGEIAETLQSETPEVDFWWLNNGITILCDEAKPHTQKEFSLDRPLIVNGLQTANQIGRHFSEKNDFSKDTRNVLVRIIKSTDETTRDKIIRATNRQTPISPTQLKATEKIHRDIEAYFKTRSKYYERRKNQYKNAGRARVDIFSINEVAQAIISISLQRPNYARARPGTLLRDSAEYKAIFSTNVDLSFFSTCAELVRLIENYLIKKTPSRKERNNLKFYMAMVGARVLARRTNVNPKTISFLIGKSLDEKMLNRIFEFCRKRYEALGGNDDVARGSNLVEDLKARLPRFLNQLYPPAKKSK